MDIKLIALDLDGTLLNSKKQLSKENRKALTECIQSGILVVPCTGRTADGIPSEIKDIDGIRYAIATNGAVIHDLKENAVLDTRMLTWEKAMELLKFVDNYPVMYDPYIEGRGITEPKFFENLSDYCLTDALQDLVKKNQGPPSQYHRLCKKHS